MHAPTARRALAVLPAFTMLLLTACGDARIGKLSAGIGRDSALKILGEGSASADTLPHVYRAERYLLGGKQVEIWFYSPTDAKAPNDTVPERDLTPIVVSDGTVTGWGWTYFDSLAKANNIQQNPR
jgi:hypothetical protein